MIMSHAWQLFIRLIPKNDSLEINLNFNLMLSLTIAKAFPFFYICRKLMSDIVDNQKKFEIFSYISIGFVAIVLILMFTKMIPDSLYVPVLIFSLILLGIRFALRFYFIIINKKKQ